MMNAKYRNALPQLDGNILLTDGGLETTLVFHEGIDLPYFAAFDLLRSLEGKEKLRSYYDRYATLARNHHQGFVLESPTWRASRDWGRLLGYSDEALAVANREAIELMAELREKYDTEATPFVISGNIGPRGDGYQTETKMTADEAAAYHGEQVAAFAGTEADMVSVLTMNYVEEAIGAARAAASFKMPIALSFTVETDGRLPSGQPLAEAIEEVDQQTDSTPAYFMINCAHPSHFSEAVAVNASWIARIGGVRANASRMSHEELDNSEVLDDGDPHELGAQYRELRQYLPNLVVLGGCCGTDHRHVEAIAQSCLTRKAA